MFPIYDQFHIKHFLLNIFIHRVAHYPGPYIPTTMCPLTWDPYKPIWPPPSPLYPQKIQSQFDLNTISHTLVYFYGSTIVLLCYCLCFPKISIFHYIQRLILCRMSYTFLLMFAEDFSPLHHRCRCFMDHDYEDNDSQK